MTVYGFNDKETANKLRQMAQGSSLGDTKPSKSYRGKGYRVFNKTSGDIPAYGIAFIRDVNTTVDNNRNLVIPVYKFTELLSESPKDMFLVNGPKAIPASKKGSMLGDQTYYMIKVSNGVNIETGKKYGVKPNSYELAAEADAETGSPLFVPIASPTSLGICAFKQVVESGGGTAFFYTGATGIPAASSKFQPNKAELEKRQFDPDTGEVKSSSPQEYEHVYNHTLSAVGAEKLIQAKKIDGVWFIDVEPCSGGA